MVQFLLFPWDNFRKRDNMEPWLVPSLPPLSTLNPSSKDVGCTRYGSVLSSSSCWLLHSTDVYLTSVILSVRVRGWPRGFRRCLQRQIYHRSCQEYMAWPDDREDITPSLWMVRNILFFIMCILTLSLTAVLDFLKVQHWTQNPLDEWRWHRRPLSTSQSP